LKLKGWPSLDLNKYELVDIEKTDKQRFVAIENGSLEAVDVLNKYPDLKSLSIEELQAAIEYLRKKERDTNSNNGLKFITVKKIEVEKLLKQLEANSD
jgi:hypothetical protein